MVQWLRLCLPTQGVRVQSLVRELRPPRAKKVKKKKKKEEKEIDLGREVGGMFK